LAERTGVHQVRIGQFRSCLTPCLPLTIYEKEESFGLRGIEEKNPPDRQKKIPRWSKPFTRWKQKKRIHPHKPPAMITPLAAVTTTARLDRSRRDSQCEFTPQIFDNHLHDWPCRLASATLHDVGRNKKELVTTDGHRWTQIRSKENQIISVFIRVHLWLKRIRSNAEKSARPFDRLMIYNQSAAFGQIRVYIQSA
jgi:hypothetical protein